ncbi:acyl carrier protein [Cellulomonas sp. NPDC055163]
MNATVDSVLTVLRGLAPAELDGLGPRTPFEEAEIDSLVLVEAAVKLSSAYGVHLEDTDVEQAGTAAGLTELILRRAAAEG